MKTVPSRLILTDPVRAPEPEAALRRARRGEGVIYRAYGAPSDPARLRALAREARRRGVLFLVAGDDRAARIPGIGGLHLPEHRLRSPSAEHMVEERHRAIPGLFVTAAAHSESAIFAAARAGADAVLVSPVFPTKSHPGAPALGPVRFARLATIARRIGLHVYALGGMTQDRTRRLRGTGLAGMAGISLVEPSRY